MPFEKLSKDESHCRLASNELVDEYNDIAKLFDEAERLPAVIESEEFSRLIKRLKKTCDQIARNHYRIGFVGPSQVGKSTSFNNVLGINKKLLQLINDFGYDFIKSSNSCGFTKKVLYSVV